MKKNRWTLKDLITWTLFYDFVQVKLDEEFLSYYNNQLEKVLSSLDKANDANPPKH